MALALLHRALDLPAHVALAHSVDGALRRSTGPVDVRLQDSTGSTLELVVVERASRATVRALPGWLTGDETPPEAVDVRWIEALGALARAPWFASPAGRLHPEQTAAGFGTASLQWTGPATEHLETHLGALRPEVAAAIGTSRAHAARWVRQVLDAAFPQSPAQGPMGPRERLRINGRPIPPGGGAHDIRSDKIARPPGFPPTIRRWRSQEHGFQAAMRLGVLPWADPDATCPGAGGVSVVIDGRTVIEGERTARVGFGTRGRAKLPAGEAALARLGVTVWVRSNDRWPVVSPYDGDAVPELVLEEVRTNLHEWARPYVAFLRSTDLSDTVPYAPVCRTKGGSVHSDAQARAVANEFLPRRSPGIAGIRAAWTEPLPEPIDLTSEDNTALPALLADPALAERVMQTFQQRKATGTVLGWSADLVPDMSRAQHTTLDAWESVRRVQVPMSEAALDAMQQIAAGPLSEWMRVAVERELGRHDPRWAIPQAAWRPVVDEVVARTEATMPDAVGIAVFGSVARGQADRGSDLDLWVVVNDDRNAAQRRLLEEFAEFRFPATLGERYRIQPLAVSVREAISHAERGDRRFMDLLREAIWFRRGPAVDEIMRAGGLA